MHENYWTNVFRIFGCDDNVLIIQSAHHIAHVKMLPNNNGQIQESLSLSTPTAIIVSHKNEKIGHFVYVLKKEVKLYQ